MTSKQDLQLRLIDYLRRIGAEPQEGNGKWRALCPLHDDHEPSLVIGTAAGALFALLGAWLAWQIAPPLVPYLLLYGYAFGMVSTWSLVEGLLVRRRQAQTAVTCEPLSVQRPGS